MRDPYAGRVPITVSPRRSANLGVSTVAAQKIMPFFRIAVESVATEVNVNKEEAEKVDQRQGEDSKHYELGSSGHSPSRRIGVYKQRHVGRV
jgi:hypothetical protein